MNWVLKKIIGSANDRLLRQFRKTVVQINALEPQMQALPDSGLTEQAELLRKKLLGRVEELGGGLTHEGRVPESAQIDFSDQDAVKGERKRRLKLERKAMVEVLPEVFALVREAGRRTLRMRHFDVQLIGGLTLHEGKIAEMATGEGKTLVATLAVTLNALLGRGVHVVTVNDYLARRDQLWMGPIYQALGLSVGSIQHDMNPVQRKAAYGCDITYGTNNEFGFDYLRDNMAISRQECVQRQPAFAIVDEVDSILIDEARTPLIISGPAEMSTDLYYKIDKIVPKLDAQTDYTIDEKAHNAFLTEDGVGKAEQMLDVENLYDDSNITLVHHINQALRAHTLFKRDVDYMIKDNQVVIVDEFTGRLMPGRRWSDGLHQAVEAKEGVKIERENQTLATITFQNYFRMYDKLAGMTGTASTEAAEFQEIYKLEVVTVPTNRPLKRVNMGDVVYKTETEKFQAVIEEIRTLQERGQPVLVGTVSIEKSERLSSMLKGENIAHRVLNAKYHEQEAQIVAQAGRYATVTIATNMAGRGTDIVLGGSMDFLLAAALKQRQVQLQGAGAEQKDIETEPDEVLKAEVLAEVQEQFQIEHEKVVAAGGLHVIGTERHESRRVDNQLRGRSGRQGDPGSSRFFVSLEDDLIRIFGENKLLEWTKASIPEGEAIEHPWLSRAIETAQKRVETHNFEIRKQILKYDDVMNRQREVVYRERREVLDGKPLKPKVLEMADEIIEAQVHLHAPDHLDPEEWKLQDLTESVKSQFGVALPDISAWGGEELVSRFQERVHQAYETRESSFGAEQMRRIEHGLMLQTIDTKWKEHLYSMDHLREGIGYRAYGQQDPLVEYQHEAFGIFKQMIGSIRKEVVELIFRVQAVHEGPVTRVFTPTQFAHPDAPDPLAQLIPAQRSAAPIPAGVSRRPPGPPITIRQGEKKVGRNDPCPCGSGKKFKKCHGG